MGSILYMAVAVIWAPEWVYPSDTYAYMAMKSATDIGREVVTHW